MKRALPTTVSMLAGPQIIHAPASAIPNPTMHRNIGSRFMRRKVAGNGDGRDGFGGVALPASGATLVPVKRLSN